MSINYKTPYQLPKEDLVSFWNLYFGKKLTWNHIFVRSKKRYAAQVKSDLAKEITHYVHTKGYKGDNRYGEMLRFVKSVKKSERAAEKSFDSWGDLMYMGEQPLIKAPSSSRVHHQLNKSEREAIDDLMNMGFQDVIKAPS